MRSINQLVGQGFVESVSIPYNSVPVTALVLQGLLKKICSFFSSKVHTKRKLRLIANPVQYTFTGEWAWERDRWIKQ
jgi:hypothetical protein